MRSITWAALFAAFFFVSCNDGVVDPPPVDPFVNPCLEARDEPPADGVQRLKTKTDFIAPDTTTRDQWTEFVYDEKGRLVVECRYSEDQSDNQIVGFELYSYGTGNSPAVRESYQRTALAADSYGQTELRAYTYEGGRLVGEESFSFINSQSEVTVYVYTASRLDRKAFYNNNFLNRYVKYLYDDSGRLVEEQEFTSSDTETQRTSYVYSDALHVESNVFKMPAKTLVRAIRYTYDEQGRKSSETSIEQDPDNADNTYVARYAYY